MTLENKLIEAAIKGDLAGVISAVEAGADVHAENDYALRWAAYYRHFAVIKFLACKMESVK